ncbi:hypothetical protein TcWFU_005409 [Taenia crassiceps]|uniref:Secreted protein n=1 Tax=Taenia crassiceps TaxID=6207 RepID=A0ABR4QDK0_9CEST
MLFLSTWLVVVVMMNRLRHSSPLFLFLLICEEWELEVFSATVTVSFSFVSITPIHSSAEVKHLNFVSYSTSYYEKAIVRSGAELSKRGDDPGSILPAKRLCWHEDSSAPQEREQLRLKLPRPSVRMWSYSIRGLFSTRSCSHEVGSWAHLPQTELSIFLHFALASHGGELDSWRRRRWPSRRVG